MNDDPKASCSVAEPPAGSPVPKGVLKVATNREHSNVEVDFDPSLLTDSQVRDWIAGHIATVESTIRKSAYRLESPACEACARKLERKLERLHGVRHASATYLGKVLCVTFDSAVGDLEPGIEEQVRKAGASIGPLDKLVGKRPFSQRLLAGELNEELSCAAGFVFLIAALVVEKTAGHGLAAHLLYGAAYLFAGQQGVRSAYASLRQGALDVDVLMVLAALGAAWIGAPFEGALLLFLFSLSNVLQSHAMDRTRRAIEALLTLRPVAALVKRGNQTVMTAVEDIAVGDVVVVKPGGQIPVDGVLTEGATHVDESSLTGESMPVAKSVGSRLFAGTLNQSGGIELRTTRSVEDSTLARMVKLVAEARAEKSRTQRFLESAEQYYAMGVIAFTIGVLLVPFAFLGESFSTAFYRAMTVMVVASPCALIISTPATVLSAIGGAARRGILIKGGSHLERAAQVDIVAIDKTGTLTVGKPSLTAIATPAGSHPLPGTLPAAALQSLSMAAALEARSEHPLAHAIVEGARRSGITPPPATAFQSTAGKGAEATIDGTRHLIGSERWFLELGAHTPAALTATAHELQDRGQTCVWLGTRDGDEVHTLAVLAMADTLRPEASGFVGDLHRLGVRRVVMLTGDHTRVAHAIAREAQVDEVRAQLLPTDKLDIIRELKKEGTVMMVGDGVNDAPALAAADVGVAMGAAGTDVAMETADIVLMGDRLENIPLLLEHTRRARRVLVQNLVFASAVIAVLITAALGFALPLPLGVVGHEGSTVLVCLNGLRLLLVGTARASRQTGLPGG